MYKNRWRDISLNILFSLFSIYITKQQNVFYVCYKNNLTARRKFTLALNRIGTLNRLTQVS